MSPGCSWAGSRAEAATALIDLADLDNPVMRDRLGEADDAPSGAIGLVEKLSRADGLVVVAPEYKNGYPGSLKNAFDYVQHRAATASLNLESAHLWLRRVADFVGGGTCRRGTLCGQLGATCSRLGRPTPSNMPCTPAAPAG
jgi:NAD(P)H-dependent FMN reductase